MKTQRIITFESLSKSFGSKEAVIGLDAQVLPGRVTGFLGPNGAGKTTILKMLLGLLSPTHGTALIDGQRYVELKRPAAIVGAALEMNAFAGGRSGLGHLKMLAPATYASRAQIEQVLDLVGLTSAASSAVRTYSLGMKQRLSLAVALLGDPDILVLDEPANGLDPAGIAWLRTFLRGLASEGRTILISSHMLSEVGQTVDDVLVVASGRLVHSGTVQSLIDQAPSRLIVRPAGGETELIQALTIRGLTPIIEASNQRGFAQIAISGGDEAKRVLMECGVRPEDVREEAETLEGAFLQAVSVRSGRDREDVH